MRFVLLFVLMFSQIYVQAHEFYVSLTNAKFIPAENSIQVSIKIFTDDLEKALSKAENTTIFLNEKKILPQHQEQIKKYLLQKFLLSVNEQKIEFNYVGSEQEDDATWCYLEFKNVKNVQSIKIENLILIDIFDTQANISHFEGFTKSVKSALNTKSNQSEILKF